VGLAFSRVSQPCTHWSRFFADRNITIGTQKLESRAHTSLPTTTPKKTNQASSKQRARG
jgi:hypothetical protein